MFFILGPMRLIFIFGPMKTHHDFAQLNILMELFWNFAFLQPKFNFCLQTILFFWHDLSANSFDHLKCFGKNVLFLFKCLRLIWLSADFSNRFKIIKKGLKHLISGLGLQKL